MPGPDVRISGLLFTQEGHLCIISAVTTGPIFPAVGNPHYKNFIISFATT